MLYSRQITTPAGTSSSSPVRTEIRAWSGVLTKVVVRFPPGPQLLLHAAIDVGGHQFFPVDPYFNVTGDDEAVVSDEFKKLSKGYNKLTIRTWNDDTQYDHECVVRITVLPESVASPYSSLQTIATSLNFILRRLGLTAK